MWMTSASKELGGGVVAVDVVVWWWWWWLYLSLLLLVVLWLLPLLLPFSRLRSSSLVRGPKTGFKYYTEVSEVGEGSKSGKAKPRQTIHSKQTLRHGRVGSIRTVLIVVFILTVGIFNKPFAGSVFNAVRTCIHYVGVAFGTQHC